MIKAIKNIAKSIREFKIYAILTPLVMIGEVAMECTIPYLMTLLTKNARVEGATLMDILPYILLLVGGALVSLTCGILGGVFAAKGSAGFAQNLRLDLYKKVQTFSFKNIDKFSASSLITRMTTDIQTLQMSFGMIIRMVVRAPLMMVFSTVMAFISGGALAWIFVGLIPFIAFVFVLIISKAMPTFTRLFKRYDAMNESVQENISGIRVVKSYVREDYERAKFKATSDSLANDFIKAEKLAALSNPALNFAIHLSNMLICFIGSHIIYGNYLAGRDAKAEGLLSVEDMSALQTYGVQILMSLMFVSMILIMLAMSIEAVRRVNEVLVEEPTIHNPENPIYELKDGSISFKNVSFKYNENAEKDTLSNLSVDIKSGEFVGIIGSTGSGKTSFVNLISRLYDISSGELLVGGHDVKEYDLVSLRDAVSVVLQKNVLFSGTIASNLRWGDLNASDEEIKKAAETAQINDFIQGLPDKFDSKVEALGNNFSGGQKQRLCIARAILKKPKILILDDSTSAVDTKTDKLLQNALRRDIPETTKIVIAQRISSIEDADKIIVMNDGVIDAIGTHAELIKTNEIYKEVYETQTKKGGKENA